MDDTFQVIESRVPESYGFSFKVLATGQLFRIQPVRDPRQPRFWCFMVYRCTRGGMVDASEQPWIGSPGMTREELPAAALAIRSGVGDWLAEADHEDLRAWLLSGAVQEASR